MLPSDVVSAKSRYQPLNTAHAQKIPVKKAGKFIGQAGKYEGRLQPQILTMTTLNFSDAWATAIKKITIDVDTLTIEIQVSNLCRYIDEVLGVTLPELSTDAVYKVVFPYHTRRSKKGTVVIRPGKLTDKPNDIFDLPPIELKNLVRGVVWRDEHFKGMTIRQIATRENLSEGFVGRLIHYSLEFC